MIYLGMKSATSQIKGQPWQNVDFFFPDAPLFTLCLHSASSDDSDLMSPGILLGYSSADVLVKPVQGRQTCWGNERLLCGDGPLRPDLSAVMLLDNKISPADRNLVDSSQSWLAQRKAMFQPGQDNVYSDLPSQPDSSSLLEILHILLSPSVPTHMQYSSSFLYHLWKCNFFPFPSWLLLTSILKFKVSAKILNICTVICLGACYSESIKSLDRETLNLNINSLVFQGDLIFLTAPVHLACPRIEEKRQNEKIDEEGQQEKQLECHFTSISIYLADTVLCLSCVCVRQPSPVPLYVQSVPLVLEVP